MSFETGHVCIFTTAHPTDDVRVNSKIAASLLEAGYSVSWVGPSRAFFTESVEVDPRIEYHLVEPAKTRVGRLAIAFRVTKAARRLKPVDWWYSPDPDAASAVIKVARRQGGRVVFDIHEAYHGALMDRWLRGHRMQPLRALVRRSIARTSARSDLVIGVNASVLAMYVKPTANHLVVRNCAPDWFAGDSVSREYPTGDQVVRVLHGKVIPSNGTNVVLDALESIGPSDPTVQVVMLNVTTQQDKFAESVRHRVSSGDLQAAVQIVEGIPHHEMPALLASVDVGMIAYGRGLGEDSLPNRLFEYMAAGLAILAPTYAVEIRDILNREHIGITADFDDPADVARALVWLRDHPTERVAMGSRARQAFVDGHSWTREFEKLAEALRSEETHAYR